MNLHRNSILITVAGLTAIGSSTGLAAQDVDPRPATAAKKTPDAELQSIGPLAFAEGHTILVSDPKAAAIHAFDISDQKGDGLANDVAIEKVGEKIAAMLGTNARGIRIIDVAVHPATRQAYVAVTRGRGNDATALIVRIGAKDAMHLVSLKGRKFSTAKLENAPDATPRDASGTGRGARRGGQRGGQRGARRGGQRASQRQQSITDIAWVQGKVIVAGLSNEEFSSKLRVIDFPFAKTDAGTSIEIYHGAHGKYETRSPVRTFVSYEIAGKPHVVAAYTCTPLVVFPLSDLEPGKKVKGKTIAELGNRNRPLDIIVYEDEGEDYLLMANSSRGVMKVPTKGMQDQESITSRVASGETAGQSYKTIESMKGVVQLDKLGPKHALVLMQSDDGALTLKSVKLP